MQLFHAMMNSGWDMVNIPQRGFVGKNFLPERFIFWNLPASQQSECKKTAELREINCMQQFPAIFSGWA